MSQLYCWCISLKRLKGKNMLKTSVLIWNLLALFFNLASNHTVVAIVIIKFCPLFCLYTAAIHTVEPNIIILFSCPLVFLTDGKQDGRADYDYYNRHQFYKYV